MKGEITLKRANVTSHNECDFGKWCKGELGRSLASHPVYEQLGKKHERVHTLCFEISVLIEKGKDPKINEAMGRFNHERLAFFKSLDELYLS